MGTYIFNQEEPAIFGNTGGGVGNPLIDLSAFPVLTEQVGFPSSPMARTGVGATPSTGTGGGLGQTALRAVADVLGWKVKPGDTAGFTGALTQAFKLTETEGHVQATWVPRTHAVQSDLSGGITGAQASLYSRAKYTLDQALPLLDGLKVLNPAAAQEDVDALRAVVRSQMTELVGELPYAGGPRVTRVTQYFQLLLGQTLGAGTVVVTDPDLVRGTMGNLRDVFGVQTRTGGHSSPLVNTIDDEQNATNYRVLSDYLTSLAQSWVSNLPYFGLGTPTPFFGTQLVLISRQLSVAAELVDELRFALDSVFIGPSERQTLQIDFSTGAQPMFLEDLLVWIQALVTDEAPAVIQSGGKFGVCQVYELVGQLQLMVAGALSPKNKAEIPAAYLAPRVTIALQTLAAQLLELKGILSPVTTRRLPINPV